MMGTPENRCKHSESKTHGAQQPRHNMALEAQASSTLASRNAPMQWRVTRTALFSALAYVVLALLWLWLMAGLLSDFQGLNPDRSLYMLAAGVGFVLITAAGLYYLLQANLHDQKTMQAARRYTRVLRWWLLGIVLMLLTVLTAQSVIIGLSGQKLAPVLLDSGEGAFIERSRARAEQITLWTQRRDQYIQQIDDQRQLLKQQLNQVIEADELSLPPALQQAYRSGLFDEIRIYDANTNLRYQHGGQHHTEIEPRFFSRTVLSGQVQTQTLWPPQSSSIQVIWLLAATPPSERIQTGPWFIALRSALKPPLASQTLSGLHGQDGLIGGFEVDELQHLSLRDLQQGWMLTGRSGDQAGLIEPLETERATYLAAQLQLPERRATLASRDSISRSLESVAVQDTANLTVLPTRANLTGEPNLLAFVPIERLNAVYWQELPEQQLLLGLKPVQQGLLTASLAAVVGMLAALWFVWQLQRLRQQYLLQTVAEQSHRAVHGWAAMPWPGLRLRGPALVIEQVNQRASALLCLPDRKLKGARLTDLLPPHAPQDQRALQRLVDQHLASTACYLQHQGRLLFAEIRREDPAVGVETAFWVQLRPEPGHAALQVFTEQLQQWLCTAEDRQALLYQPDCPQHQHAPFARIRLFDKPAYNTDQANGAAGMRQTLHQAMARAMYAGQYMSVQLSAQGRIRYWVIPHGPVGQPVAVVWVLQLSEHWANKLADQEQPIEPIELGGLLGQVLAQLQRKLLV